MQHTVDDSAVYLVCNNQPVKVMWNELKSITHLPESRAARHSTTTRKNHIALITKDNKKIPVDIPDDQMQSFLTDLFTHWKKHAPEEAKKSAFDYANDEKPFWRILFFLNFFIVGGISVIFLSDGLNTLSCSRLLLDDAATVMTQASITKIKKSRRGNITWDLEFTTPDGKPMKGRRVAINPDVALYLPGKREPTTGVIYALENPSCFDVTISATRKKIPKAQRWFSADFTLGFGTFFAVAWGFLTCFFYFKLTETRPYKDLVCRIYETHLLG